MHKEINNFQTNFRDLDQKGRTIVEYVWLGGSGLDIRSKSKTFNKVIESLKDINIYGVFHLPEKWVISRLF